jgi:glutathione S-transferase
MPKLLWSPASPYSAKVRMAAAYAGIAIDSVITETGPQPEALTSVNPLGKIPVLIADDGRAIYDSRVITQYLDRESSGKLFPRNPGKRLNAEQLEALADGICDVLLAHVYERRMRPAEKVHDGWLELQWSKAVRALDMLCADMPKLPQKITAGHIALRAAIGYLDLRFAGKWERGHTKLKRWAARFDQKFPELARLTPDAPAAS